MKRPQNGMRHALTVLLDPIPLTLTAGHATNVLGVIPPRAKGFQNALSALLENTVLDAAVA